MPGTSNYAFDSTAPIDIGFLDHEFGIVFPSETGFNIRSQTGGVSCHQLEFSGVFLPLKHPHIHRDKPDWYPQNETEGGIPLEEKHPVTNVDLETIPEEDYESLPPWVTERDPVQFYNWEEYRYWLDNGGWCYGHADLIDELRQWNYCPDGTVMNSNDMTRVWDGLEDIWATIKEESPFTFERYDYHQKKLDAVRTDEEPDFPIGDEYPEPCEGIEWITITGSKKTRDGTILTPWAEELAGETVILNYPNSD